MIGKIIWFSCFAFIAYWLYIDISDITFAQLTGKMIGNNVLAIFFAYIGFSVFYDN